MKIWDVVFKGIILIIGMGAIGFDLLLYHSFESQKAELSSIKDKQDVEAEFNSNKFKFQQDQMEHINKDLDEARQQTKEQRDLLTDQQNALIQEAEKRQQVENDNKSVQTSLVDIKAEADAIKQDMKGWQKDYVGILAQLERKMDDSQTEMKLLETNLTALNIPELKENIKSLKADIEKMNQPSDNNPPAVSSTDDKKTGPQQPPTQP